MGWVVSQELIFEMSDYFLCVVNDFTSLDQRYLDKLTRNLQNSKKDFREVIVVHNCKEVIDEDTLRHVWETQVMLGAISACSRLQVDDIWSRS